MLLLSILVIEIISNCFPIAMYCVSCVHQVLFFWFQLLLLNSFVTILCGYHKYFVWLHGYILRMKMSGIVCLGGKKILKLK